MRTRHTSRPLFGALLALLLLFGAAPAYAAGARCTLTAIEGSNPKEGKGVDPELAGIKELTRPPLSASFSRFKLLGKVEAELEPGAEKEVALTKAHTAKLLYSGDDATGKLKLNVDLPSVKFSAGITLKNGGTFMIVRDSGFLTAVSCAKK